MTRKLNKIALDKHISIIGPATVGGVKPGCLKIGNTGGMMDNILHSKLYRPGRSPFISFVFLQRHKNNISYLVCESYRVFAAHFWNSVVYVYYRLQVISCSHLVSRQKIESDLSDVISIRNGHIFELIGLPTEFQKRETKYDLIVVKWATWIYYYWTTERSRIWSFLFLLSYECWLIDLFE